MSFNTYMFVDIPNLVEMQDDEVVTSGNVFLKVDPDGICNYVKSQDEELPPNLTVAQAKAQGFVKVFKTK